MTQQRPLTSQVLDVLVRTPLQLVRQLCDQAPLTVSEGRTRVAERVKVARWVGEMAVNYGRIELERRLATVAVVPQPALVLTASPEQLSAAESLEPPFEGYDQLAAAQVVRLLARLPHAELLLIRDYEQGRRARRTVLAKLEQLLSA